MWSCMNKKPLVLLRIIHKFNAVCLRKAQIVFLHPKVMIFKMDLIFLKDPSIDLDLWSYKFLDPLEDLGSLILKFSDTPNDLWSCVKILKKDLLTPMPLILKIDLTPLHQRFWMSWYKLRRPLRYTAPPLCRIQYQRLGLDWSRTRKARNVQS